MHYSSEYRRASILLGGYARRVHDTSAGGAPEGAENVLSTMVERAGISGQLKRRLLWFLTASVSVFLCLSVVTAQACWMVGAVGTVGGAFGWLNTSVFRRMERFERDYTALLLALASSVRTGLDPLTALLRCGELFDDASEVRKEIARLHQAIEQGATEEGAVRAFGRTVAHPDLSLFRTAFILSRQQGASLGECLHRLARVTRQRQSFRRKTRSSVAMQKMSALGIGGCAIAIGLFQVITNPAAVTGALTHPVGAAALTVGAGLMVLGFGWMFRLTQQRV